MKASTPHYLPNETPVVLVGAVLHRAGRPGKTRCGEQRRGRPMTLIQAAYYLSVQPCQSPLCLPHGLPALYGRP